MYHDKLRHDAGLSFTKFAHCHAVPCPCAFQLSAPLSQGRPAITPYATPIIAMPEIRSSIAEHILNSLHADLIRMHLQVVQSLELEKQAHEDTRRSWERAQVGRRLDSSSGHPSIESCVDTECVFDDDFMTNKLHASSVHLSVTGAHRLLQAVAHRMETENESLTTKLTAARDNKVGTVVVSDIKPIY